MKYYLFIGILLLILICSLVVEIFFNFANDNMNINEEFQGFSVSQIANMGKCTAAEITRDTSCTYFQYYDQNEKLLNGYFKSVPYNYYIDPSYILQPVPYGNVVTPDKRGYVFGNITSTYAELQKQQGSLAENAIKTADICSEQDPDYIDRMKCFDTQYVIMNNNKPSLIYNRIRVPNGYYVDINKDRKGILTKVPYGYKINADKRGITPTDEYQAKMSNTNYDTNNYDVKYHSDPTDNTDMSNNSVSGTGKMWVLDSSGNLVSIPYNENKNTTLYYEPGSFRFGSSNYIPNYEESIYLSKLTNTTSVSPYLDAENRAGGFCEYYKNNPEELEQKCNDMSANSCASTSCCVLLGGQKCVYGDSQGPYYKTNYSNFLITNPEFYYYQGKCYGKCM